jgi:hypothetical protein
MIAVVLTGVPARAGQPDPLIIGSALLDLHHAILISPPGLPAERLP